MSTNVLPKCARCNGKMMLEIFNQPCEQCKTSGATVCGSCWVHEEHTCINCGGTVYMKPRRRREMIIENQIREAVNRG